MLDREYYFAVRFLQGFGFASPLIDDIDHPAFMENHALINYATYLAAAE